MSIIAEYTPVDQLRTAESKTLVTSLGINVTNLGSYPGNKVITFFKDPDINNTTLNIYPFICIVDSVSILFGASIYKTPDNVVLSIPIPDDSTYYVGVVYTYTGNPDTQKPAKIVISDDINDFDLLICSIDNYTISEKAKTLKQIFDAVETLPSTVPSNEDVQNLIDAHNTDPNAHQSIIDYVDNKISTVSITNFIQKPSITNPTNGETGFSGTITSSPFTTSDKFYGNHDASDWEIAEDPDFTNIVDSSYDDDVNLTSYNPNNLQPLTTYYVRVRYKSDYHISPWSDAVEFTTSDAYIETPTVSCTTGDSVYPTFKLTPFNAVGYSDNWQSTDWQISTDSSFNNIIYSTTKTDVADTLTIDWDLLSVNSTYYIRAKYNGDQGHSSNWSSPYELNTGLYKIEYQIPTQENELSVVEDDVTHDNGRIFNTSEYALNGNVSHGTLSITGMHFVWNLPEVNQDTTANITLWVTRNSDGNDVTEKVSKQLTIKDVPLTSDTAVSVSNFNEDNTEYNDGWDLTA